MARRTIAARTLANFLSNMLVEICIVCVEGASLQQRASGMFPNMSQLEFVGARLTKDERKLAQQVWGQGWADTPQFAPDLIKRRKAYITRATRGAPYMPHNLKANAPDDTWPPGQRPAEPQLLPRLLSFLSRQATEVAPQAAVPVRLSTLHLDIPAFHPEHSDDSAFYIRTQVESVEALEALVVDTPAAKAALLEKFDPRSCKLWTPPYNSPEVNVQTSNDPYGYDHHERMPWNQRPLYIVVQGQAGYDGPGPQMVSFGAPNRSSNNITSTIQRLMHWFRQDDGHAWFQDDRGLYGPANDWVGQAIDKRAISISSELYVYMSNEQKQELLHFGYEEVHIQAASERFIMDIYVNPSDNNDQDETERWQARLQRRRLPRDANVQFIYEKAYADSLPRLVQEAFIQRV